MKKAIMNWSGGKDSAFCIYRVLQKKEYDVQYLLTTISETYRRISMHGVREALLDEQAGSIGIPLEKIFLQENESSDVYEKLLSDAMSRIMSEGTTCSIFGDIFLEDLRTYRENQLAKTGFEAVFPLWKYNTKQLSEDFIDAGFKSIVVCVDEKYLEKSFAGRIFDREFLNTLPAGIDPCGENGEFHTFVFDGPIFKKKINFTKGEIVYRHYQSEYDPQINTGFWYCDLVPEG
jgi:uncharacterized protein (TIGR00290 family)